MLEKNEPTELAADLAPERARPTPIPAFSLKVTATFAFNFFAAAYTLAFSSGVFSASEFNPNP